MLRMAGKGAALRFAGDGRGEGGSWDGGTIGVKAYLQILGPKLTCQGIVQGWAAAVDPDQKVALCPIASGRHWVGVWQKWYADCQQLARLFDPTP